MGPGEVKPGKLLKIADAYAVEEKPGTPVLALAAAVIYSAVQIHESLHQPSQVTSLTEWSDTQGPFPMVIRCVAANGCYVSNRHNDAYSSHGDKVQQKGCLFLAEGEEQVLNITFTKNPLNGLTVIWDPSTPPPPGSPPGTGLAIGADMNCPPPACASGVMPMFTPVLGGSYLANYVQTANETSPVAPLRREWFVDFVARDSTVDPAMTACADKLSPAQVAAYHQATVRIMSAWYRVRIYREHLTILSLPGICGGALELCLQVGAAAVIALELAKCLVPRHDARGRDFLGASGGEGGAGSVDLQLRR
ncbi:hypothetical protein Rsub_11417 [Raphidocelis subcapitata]|uniref:Uncharacterized protein n=1 Tax=Raphidocelis subcapitata TaxID=307507 RepID=A0A2V0PKZ9_9CHLO|nr:hypothetical protein Rsub_11417 [Raphidocelis subcapitata]|eukprot:GBF98703.1 hypothetical protein Rsub_11417 [Raphidocelis subcapitata]